MLMRWPLGDYNQLLPVLAFSLANPSDNKPHQQAARSMYLEYFRHAVKLDVMVRQDANSDFAQLVNEVRDRTLTEDHANDLNSRCVTNPAYDASDMHDGSLVGIMASNDDRSAFNDVMAYRKTSPAEPGYCLHANIMARDGSALSDPELEFLHTVGDGFTEHIPFRLFVSRGSPVMLTQNVAVRGGVANGSRGTIVGFVWPIGYDPSQEPVQEYCIPGTTNVLGYFRVPTHMPERILIYIPEGTFEPFAGLEPFVWPLQYLIRKDVKTNLRIVNGGVKLRRTFKVDAPAMVVAFGVTVYKSQGSTFDNVYINLTAARTLALEQFVIISRVRTLASVHMAKPVTVAHLRTAKPAYLTVELLRIDALAQATEV